MLLKMHWIENNEKTQTIFRKCGIDNAAIRTDEDYVKALMYLFKKRI